MTTPPAPLDTILALQVALRQLQAAEERLHGIPDWMRDLHEEYSTRKAEIDALDSTASGAAAERRAGEASTADAQEKLKHYQQQINLVRTQREYGALLHEIDGTRVKIKEFEEQALQAMEREGEALQQLATLRAAFADLDTRYAQELAKWEQEKPAVQREVEEVSARVAELRARVSPPLLARFNRLIERRRGDALAVVRRVDRGGRGPQIFSCGACNYRVRPQAVVEIQEHGALVECDSCKRILYLAPEGS